MCTATFGDNIFVLLDDPSAPLRADYAAAQQQQQPGAPPIPTPSHFRATYITLKAEDHDPVGQLIGQLKARWAPVRPSTAATAQKSQGANITIEGRVYRIGRDWLVRVGNVRLTNGTLKGMFLEAEYLPLPALRTPTDDGTSELLSNLLTSILPTVKDSNIVTLAVGDEHWAESTENFHQEFTSEITQEPGGNEGAGDDDDIYATGDEKLPPRRKSDWIGVERDKRSAFIILSTLRSEGIL